MCNRKGRSPSIIRLIGADEVVRCTAGIGDREIVFQQVMTLQEHEHRRRRMKD
jgi:hypothetical protein